MKRALLRCLIWVLMVSWPIAFAAWLTMWGNSVYVADSAFMASISFMWIGAFTLTIISLRYFEDHIRNLP
jgi:lysylphosphatidylglycerol synthetase-like protein (DUF2156 family)